MARRKDHTREELFQLAVECGREIVVAEGPNALTARNVAKHMGYTPGTLYNIFDNIDGLTQAINIDSLNRFTIELEEIIRTHSKTKKRLKQISAAYLDFQAQQPHLWTLLFAKQIENKSEPYQVAINSVFNQVAGVLLDISSSPKAARQDAKVLWSTLHGICLLKKSEKLDVGKNDSADALIERFLKNYFKL